MFKSSPRKESLRKHAAVYQMDQVISNVLHTFPITLLYFVLYYIRLHLKHIILIQVILGLYNTICYITTLTLPYCTAYLILHP